MKAFCSQLQRPQPQNVIGKEAVSLRQRSVRSEVRGVARKIQATTARKVLTF